MSLNIIIAFVMSFVLSLLVTLQVIRFSQRSGLGDKPDEGRKIHTQNTPNLGGIGIFIATCVTYFAFCDYSNAIRPDKLFAISIFLFFVGVLDDLEPITAFKRLLIEFICAFFIIYITDIRLTTFWGVFGIEDMPITLSYILTSIFIVGCINAYNFIDGIDGLLGSIALLGAVCFGFIFNLYDEWLWTLLCIAMCGALLGFLFFNWYPSKIFMGDGGALFIGTIFACFAVRTMQLPPISTDYLTINMPHTIAFSLVAVPIIDMVTVFILRVSHGYSPLKADNRHSHHRLINMGLNHDKSTLVLMLANISIVVFAFFIQNTGALRSFIFLIAYCFLLELLLIYISWIYKNKLHARLNK